MDPINNDLEALGAVVRDLAARVERLEKTLALTSQPVSPSAVQVPPAQAPVETRPAPPPPPPPPPATPVVAPMPPQPTLSQGAARPMPARDIDLESRIGSHWLNRIGITAVLIGVSYFLKYAFDNNWIGPAGRVAIGLLAGIGVVVWSERFRQRGYRVFSYSLKAVGIGALYLSLWAAFQVYQLIPSGVAFAAMFVVTASTVALAITQDAEILAAFALTGGFATPLLLSTGENRELALFSYVALLDLATLALVARRPWQRLLLLSYAGTLVLYMGWYSRFYDQSQIAPTIVFATIFFAIFAIAPLIVAQPPKQAAVWGALPLFLALVNAAVYFLQVYTMVPVTERPMTAWFALGLAAVYIGLSRLHQRHYADAQGIERLHFLHLALAIGFITVAIPVRLDHHWITMGWFVEAGVLLWVARRTRSDFLNLFAVGALVLGIVRLLAIDNFDTSQLIFNARIATYAVALAVLGAIIWAARGRTDAAATRAVALASVAFNGLAIYALSLEISDYYGRAMAAASRLRYQPWDPMQSSNWRSLRIAESFSYSALWMAYGALLMIVGFWRRSAFVRWQALFLIAVTIVKVFVYDVSQLDRGYRIVSFIVLGVLLLAISFVYQRDWLQLTGKPAAGEPGEAQ